MDIHKLLALFERAGAFLIGDSPLLGSVNIERPIGEDDNEVICASWTDGECEYRVIFDEGGLIGGRWEGGFFIAEDTDGDEIKIRLFALTTISGSDLNQNIATLDVEQQVENIVLEVAGLFNDLTTSDLQGVANARARDIVRIVRGHG